MSTLDDLLNPKAVAIIGASDSPNRIGGRPISYMKMAGYKGRILPINPKRETIQDLPAYKTVAEARETYGADIDCAIIAIPAAAVPQAVRDCAAAGVHACIIFSSGFAEADAAGSVLQDELVAISKDTGIRIVGPNCLGVFDANSGFMAAFTTTLERGAPKPGAVSVVSQSGAYGSHIYFVARLRGLNVGKMITTGNECDLDVAECIELFAQDPETKVIAAYAEGVKDGTRLVKALELARANRKPVIFMKVGQSEVGALAASSHTAALAGEDSVYDAVLRQYGAHRARSTEEMLDIAYMASFGVFPAGRRLGLVTISGGGGVLMADAAAAEGLDVAAMPEDAQRALKEKLPFAAPRNPVDVTAQAFNDVALIEANMKIMLEQGGYDAIVAFFTSVAGSPVLAPGIRQAMDRGRAGYEGKTLIAMSLVADQDIVEGYENDGYPIFEDPTRAVVAMAALMRFGESFHRKRTATPEVPDLPPLPTTPLSEQEAKGILSQADIPMVPDRLVTSADKAAAAGKEFGGRLVLKIASPDILHKTEVGGVVIGVPAEDAGEAYHDLVTRIGVAVPEARIDGVLVTPMVDGGVECLLGVKNDPVFGPIVVFGLGGIMTEVLRDVVFRRAPFGLETAHDMLREIKAAAMLEGVRGTPAADKDALAQALSNLSVFAAAHADQLDSIDINPVRALPDGAVALDALIVPRIVPKD
ncbi:MAG: acetate--CoA ligase family protein [Alphaproteobacteria bacterium]|nr:acetate--CoA ligase family protein [Alphaproteobacteria bacterium]